MIFPTRPSPAGIQSFVNFKHRKKRMQIHSAFKTNFTIVFISMFFSFNFYQMAAAQDAGKNGNDKGNNSLKQFAQAGETADAQFESLRSDPIFHYSYP